MHVCKAILADLGFGNLTVHSLQCLEYVCRLFEVNPKGSVPAIKELESGKWIVDSGEFVDYLEDKYPEPRLGKADSAPAA